MGAQMGWLGGGRRARGVGVVACRADRHRPRGVLAAGLVPPGGGWRAAADVGVLVRHGRGQWPRGRRFLRPRSQDALAHVRLPRTGLLRLGAVAGDASPAAEDRHGLRAPLPGELPLPPAERRADQLPRRVWPAARRRDRAVVGRARGRADDRGDLSPLDDALGLEGGQPGRGSPAGVAAAPRVAEGRGGRAGRRGGYALGCVRLDRAARRRERRRRRGRARGCQR
mmetsp:Transcript_90754/g.277859  ORF Transcript_90754/g.277859 Transcript_90754/m.277859 type:complete len:226 (+) Transcript_90754:681-1358(+)